jgi:hypothetical protein
MKKETKENKELMTVHKHIIDLIPHGLLSIEEIKYFDGKGTDSHHEILYAETSDSHFAVNIIITLDAKVMISVLEYENTSNHMGDMDSQEKFDNSYELSDPNCFKDIRKNLIGEIKKAHKQALTDIKQDIEQYISFKKGLLKTMGIKWPPLKN